MLEWQQQSNDYENGFWRAIEKVGERHGLTLDEGDELIEMLMLQLQKEGLLDGFGLFAQEGVGMDEVEEIERLSIDDMAILILAVRRNRNS